MPTDIDAIVNNLSSFYDMKGKSVLHVGAGGGQLIGYAVDAGSILGVDSDPEAVSHLKTAIHEMGLEDRFRVIQGDFNAVSAKADVVFFEFCLHEMDDPAAALRHAWTLAPNIVILDHVPESRWAWYTCEEGKAARSWAAVRQLGIAREVSFKTIQHFATYAQLFDKIKVLGEEAIGRIGEFSGRDDIVIAMDYAIALVSKDESRGA